MSKTDPPKLEKYSKTMGGLFQITLCTYSQQGRKSDPENPYFGEVFGTRIDPRSRKSALEIVTKIKPIFHQIFY